MIFTFFSLTKTKDGKTHISQNNSRTFKDFNDHWPSCSTFCGSGYIVYCRSVDVDVDVDHRSFFHLHVLNIRFLARVERDQRLIQSSKATYSGKYYVFLLNSRPLILSRCTNFAWRKFRGKEKCAKYFAFRVEDKFDKQMDTVENFSYDKWMQEINENTAVLYPAVYTRG